MTTEPVMNRHQSVFPERRSENRAPVESSNTALFSETVAAPCVSMRPVRDDPATSRVDQHTGEATHQQERESADP